MANYPDNVILLLLQIILERQQNLSHIFQNQKANKEKYEKLLERPIIDQEILSRFVTDKLVIMYAPELCEMQLRSLKTLVLDIFNKGIEGEDKESILVNVITLANYYYYKRIKDIEETRLPELRSQMKIILEGKT
ncbi:hypothetical protein TPHA_0B02290 [Tetrapisispora phaffii CBS 4417]|uniref:Uncharacterized protein n=1 Tax=Tetrapisispora phaffii (strain ATCC 24235 / CBS 4417 / NBRC 1672 / NRRL Y-8282 / UCD 70-5) TaxID=1071381 RepID=G8BPH0_TETPH|nr:hypothetical protein TPHA_0B02290 [Tetrapisispora phaffii CBS 4417]CCE61901.1 hypothetical protein TPHA_0B02290 [Tetrapisispora phaffii CBS 4417]